MYCANSRNYPGLPRFILIPLLLLASLLLVAAGLDRLFPPDLSRADGQSVLVVDAKDRLLRAFTTANDSWRLPLDLAAVDPLYLTMLRAYEDRRFDHHPGVDPVALGRALVQWGRAGRVVSGASTLSMQVARLLEPRPRTLAGKTLEMLRALQLEWRYTKADILTLYLHLAPYGGNLEGLRAASLAWLGKEPRRLTAAEAALLVVLPQAPAKRRPDRFPAAARVARDKVLRRMAQLGVLTESQAVEAMQEALPTARRALPLVAPHLAQRRRTAQPHQTRYRTFIDGDLQQTLENLARQQPLDSQASLAILVVANADRRVLAYLGSADFFATARLGQVDMVRAVRSPGSTLKPLVYGMGFEDLLIHPDTLIEDVPTRFGNYSPTNFRDTYQGQLSIREALQRSLNIPAVAVLEQVGPGRVAARLRDAGIRLHWRQPHAQPALPLVLGGVGITLEQLVTLYAGLADGGQVAPLRFGPDEPLVKRDLLSPAAAWYLGRILETAAVPETVVPDASRRRARAIAYKTGTSYGFRDAWALGYDRRYTVGVWVGRADGSPSPGHYGLKTAAPLLYHVFDLLPDSDPVTPVAPPPGVILTERETLPERLRVFRRQPVGGPVTAAPLAISFPVTGSTVELTRTGDGRLTALPLVASGGSQPLRWLVNGRPVVGTPLRRTASWLPDGVGMVRITVLDAAGQVAHSEVWVAPPDENNTRLATTE